MSALQVYCSKLTTIAIMVTTVSDNVDETSNQYSNKSEYRANGNISKKERNLLISTTIRMNVIGSCRANVKSLRGQKEASFCLNMN